MPKFFISEVKEIVIETEIEAADAQTAISRYKQQVDTNTLTISEETHITVKETKEDIQ
ncbi:hypothetical protein K7T73_06845 [Bacillus badius]|uniref:hypothetical protein n=1 Tax=Bacillus badius TaxID=1455 RepID=UPI001CBCF5D3|nr:hypothetical protein [Bacillus badius]UAT31933.1 hypothetical protein K7T73_06845 [Bacillus badius]